MTTNVSSNVRITYNKEIAGKHDLTFGGNMDYYMTDVDNVSITGYGVGTQMSPALINQSITGNRKPSVGSHKEKTAQLGVGLVAGYSFATTYDFLPLTKLMLLLFFPKINVGMPHGQSDWDGRSVSILFSKTINSLHA